jgi:hypothetical protein
MEYETVKMLNALERHINRRSGLEAQDYAGNRAALRADRREIARDGSDCRAMLRYLRRCYQLQAETVSQAIREGYGGRVAYDAQNQRIDFTPGQYWPTEYRAAAASVLAKALYLHITRGVSESRVHVGRMYAERELGRGIARRWFA